MLAYPRCAVGPLPLHLGHHYPAVRWTNKALGRCEGATQLCKHLTSQQDSAASATLVVCVLCTGNQPQSVIKSSCFPPCRLTGRPSCDTIWTSNYSTDERRKSIFVRPSHLHATNAKFFIPVHFHIVTLGPGHYLLRATICFLNLFFVFVPSHCHLKRSFKKTKLNSIWKEANVAVIQKTKSSDSSSTRVLGGSKI